MNNDLYIFQLYFFLLTIIFFDDVSKQPAGNSNAMSSTNETSFVSIVDNQDRVLSGANFAATKIPYRSQSVVDSLYSGQVPSSLSNQVIVMS
jgi:hypothetical protein